MLMNQRPKNDRHNLCWPFHRTQIAKRILFNITAIVSVDRWIRDVARPTTKWYGNYLFLRATTMIAYLHVWLCFVYRLERQSFHANINLYYTCSDKLRRFICPIRWDVSARGETENMKNHCRWAVPNGVFYTYIWINKWSTSDGILFEMPFQHHRMRKMMKNKLWYRRNGDLQTLFMSPNT